MVAGRAEVTIVVVVGGVQLRVSPQISGGGEGLLASLKFALKQLFGRVLAHVVVFGVRRCPEPLLAAGKVTFKRLKNREEKIL